MRWLSLLLMPLFLIGANVSAPIGVVDLKAGANVRYFTTSPGSKGIPNSIVYSKSGKVEVYEIFDWSTKSAKLKGHAGHVWMRISLTNSYWIYFKTNYAFYSN